MWSTLVLKQDNGSRGPRNTAQHYILQLQSRKVPECWLFTRHFIYLLSLGPPPANNREKSYFKLYEVDVVSVTCFKVFLYRTRGSLISLFFCSVRFSASFHVAGEGRTAVWLVSKDRHWKSESCEILDSLAIPHNHGTRNNLAVARNSLRHCDSYSSITKT